MCEIVKKKNILLFWLEDMKVPYLKINQEWFGYENKRSLRAKVNSSYYITYYLTYYIS